MIAAVRGTILSKGVSWLVVDVSGVGYRVEVPTEFAARHHTGDRVFLHTQLVVRQDAMTLFGFDTAEALDMFNILIGVSGVGPRSGLAVMSELSPAEIAGAVANEDDKPFRAVPGIGPKTAKLILVSLTGKLNHIVLAQPEADGSQVKETDGVSASVIAGLTSLGWTEAQAEQAVSDAVEAGAPSSAGGLLKAALALLQRPSR